MATISNLPKKVEICIHQRFILFMMRLLPDFLIIWTLKFRDFCKRLWSAILTWKSNQIWRILGYSFIFVLVYKHPGVNILDAHSVVNMEPNLPQFRHSKGLWGSYLVPNSSFFHQIDQKRVVLLKYPLQYAWYSKISIGHRKISIS